MIDKTEIIIYESFRGGRELRGSGGIGAGREGVGAVGAG